MKQDKNLKLILSKLDGFSKNLVSLIAKLVKQKIVSLDVILAKLPDNIKEDLVKKLSKQKKGGSRSR